MNLAQLLSRLRADPAFLRNVTRWEVIPPAPARHGDWPAALDPRLVAAMRARGCERLYSHQAAAVDQILAGRSVVVETPTASGKTLCYNLPVFDALLKNPETRALYLFPTKALSQDQMHEALEVVRALGVDLKVHTFDGDTPENARRAIRASGHIVVTNPDMLHQGILPHHTLWVKLFENLRYVVVDEVHQYRGVFGSHVANVLRRLKRIAAFYGARPQFICCSATIANPRELAGQLTGEPLVEIADNGAPRGEKHFIFYNPPVVNAELGIRRSSVKETRAIAERFLAAGAQTIVFARSRIRVELLLTYLEQAGRKVGIRQGEVRGYRGGYLPTERRAIEQGLRDGSVRAVVSTNALELGIDIGRLDACIMCGYAGTVASTWQQAGRAGRRHGLSAVVLVGTSSPADQYILGNPDYFLGRSPEHGTIDPENLIILMSHLKCAAFELPFRAEEEFGERRVAEILDYLVDERVLHRAEGRYHWMADTYPAEDVSLRAAAPDNVVIVDHSVPAGRVIGEMDLFSAQEMLHDEAIYIHGAQQYHVDKLDWDRRKAYVQPVRVDYYTDAQRKVELKTLEAEEHRPDTVLGELGTGEIGLVDKVTVYKKIKLGSHENVGAGRVNLPEMEMHTTSFWWQLPATVAAEMAADGVDLGDALKGLAHLLGTVAPVFVMADVRDLHAQAMLRAPFTDAPTLYLYDSVPGGVGFARRIFQQWEEIRLAALAHVRRCPCHRGCPSCVGAVVESGDRAKAGAAWLLARAAGLRAAVD
ncbi:MAG TPA: DEAD/DEAH box helicase [Candidatus Krumholzibacteria bacterium]|nr:DEAD/DEAH box helicase [Candidatus Krumholzibacteria bacterium]HPD71758.1 DEAD/DEAH box helicase [Candidatus Krumholzibacteria bacterium]HRY41309.1 DEAD/DEAH box helicase [Candidatus Krumholzibacteria bacterium]